MNGFKLWYRSQPVALRTLITINVVFYVAWLLVLGNVPVLRGFVYNHLALNPGLPGVLLEAWQVVTYNFLHFGFLHVLFNMLWLWWMGREFEDLRGAHYMLSLYLIGGVGGGLFSVLGYALLPGVPPFIVGASASVMALLAAVVTLNPRRRIRLFLFGSVRLLWLLVGYLALNVLFARGSNTAVLAHLGGAGTGYLFVKAGERGIDLTSWAKIFFSGNGRSTGSYTSRRSSPGASSSGGGLFGNLFGGSERSGRSGSPSRRETLRQERDRKKAEQSARRREVDRILEKISAEGWDGLTDEEKRTLEDASQD